ncbi:hypothetical protein ABO04_01535 [Nitrosomonas sp. HPC101]|uniref:hypothetical protein n=1 Tax=Nitrosomonas sp. HPC101 TaxID=1658667 RepID=UPI001368364D|nr:hypothetical protein [Nitrosomonas sp. HPC101]MXS84626.1 hypothetical protein [Nitrosomonas sp. HPC101]
MNKYDPPFSACFFEEIAADSDEGITSCLQAAVGPVMKGNLINFIFDFRNLVPGCVTGFICPVFGFLSQTFSDSSAYAPGNAKVIISAAGKYNNLIPCTL